MEVEYAEASAVEYDKKWKEFNERQKIIRDIVKALNVYLHYVIQIKNS